MKTNISGYSAAACALLCVVGAAFTIGGPLDPPMGPITPTYKTLTEVEPRIAINAVNTPGDAGSTFRITEPGSYYLTGNVIGVAGKNGIEVAVDNVTIDLNGFQLIGMENSREGICVTATGSRLVSIRNGSVRGWGESGVCTVNVSGSVLLELRAWNNAGRGIEAGPSAVIRNCTAQANLLEGITVGNNGSLSGCTVQENTGAGMVLGNGSVVDGCTSGHNLGVGIIAGTGCTLTSTTVRYNGVDGFQLDYGCTITASTAAFNARDGFATLGAGVSIRGCTSEANTRDGLRALADCIIADSTFDSNGYGSGVGAGIHTMGFHNRIEGNNITDCDVGIQVDVAHSVIIRNTLADNGVNLVIAPGNMAGALVTNETELHAANANSNMIY